VVARCYSGDQIVEHECRNGGGGRERETHIGILWGNVNESDLLEDLGVDGKILLKLVVKK